MIQFVWPVVLLLLPVPLLVSRFLPAAKAFPATALRAPLYDGLPQDVRADADRIATKWRYMALSVWCLLVVAAAQPQWAGDSRGIPATGRDLMMVVDISGSMRTADFMVAGQALDRLSVVKTVGGNFIDRRKGDRVGLVLFGGRPYVRAPLSFERRTVRRLLDESEIALAGEHTALGDAIGLAIKRLMTVSSKSRVVVILSDGANNQGSIGPLQAAKLAKKEGIRIYTIGIGREDLSAPNPFGPWSAGGYQEFNVRILREVADVTGGRYLEAFDGAALEDAYRQLDLLEPALSGSIEDFLALPLFQWPLGAALVLSAIAVLAATMGGRR